MMQSFRECIPEMKEEMISGTIHFTITLETTLLRELLI